MTRKFKIGTDCSGVEAPIEALKILGVNYSHEFSSEIDPKCIKLIKEHYHPKVLYEDLYSRDNRKAKKVNLYICGFPCQPFSLAGYRRGTDDAKGVVFFQCLKYVKMNQPDMFIFENVRGLKTISKGNTFKNVMQLLKDLGTYDIKYDLLNSKDYGIPHSRSRLYIVGILKSKVKKQFYFPEKTISNINLTKYIDWKDDNKTIQSPSVKAVSKLSPTDAIFVDSAFRKYKHPFANIRAPCLCRNSGMWNIPAHRRLNLNEALALLGFPQHFPRGIITDKQIISRLGNTMSINILVLIIDQMFKSIGYKHYKKIPKDSTNYIKDVFTPNYKLSPR